MLLWLNLRHFEKKLEQRRTLLEEQLGLAEAGPEAPETGSLEELLRHATRAQAQEIEAALGRIRRGVFGVCERCSEWLPPQRLEAAPWARCCFLCQTVRLGSRLRLVPYRAAPHLGAGSNS